MEQPWWVYVAIAFGCAVLFLLSKVVENKFTDEEDGLWVFNYILCFVGFLATYKAAEVLKFFE